jgi:hypothetical protein
VSEHQAEQTQGEPGSVGAGPAAPNSSDPLIEAVMASVREISTVESATIAPDREAPKDEPPKTDAPEMEAPKVEAPKADAPRPAGNILTMSPGERSWHGEAAASLPESEPVTAAPGKRRFAAMAAVVALAAVAGALGGALATAGLTHVADAATTRSGEGALEASVARINADVLALKASVEQTSKMGVSQFNKTSDRLDKLERAQAEPAAKLAKLSEAVDKLRAASAAAPAAVAAAPAAPKEVTGSIAPPAAATTAAVAPAAVAPPKAEVGKLPTVEGWVLRDVSHGSALIENRRGTYEVFAGDALPGLGRIDAIRRQDGRWVVVTSKGLIVAR